MGDELELSVNGWGEGASSRGPAGVAGGGRWSTAAAAVLRAGRRRRGGGWGRPRRRGKPGEGPAAVAAGGGRGIGGRRQGGAGGRMVVRARFCCDSWVAACGLPAWSLIRLKRIYNFGCYMHVLY